MEIPEIVIKALRDSRNSHTYESQTAIQRAQRAENKRDVNVLYLRAKSFERLQDECLDALHALGQDV